MPNKIATIKTSEGSFTVELFTDSMPLTAYNFIDLANKVSTWNFNVVSAIFSLFSL